MPVTITWVGDVLLAGSVGELARQRGAGWLFAELDGLLLQDDITVGNLECAVCRGGRPQIKQYTFRADPALLPGLKSAGVEAVTLANNHSLDYGRGALLETIDHLREAAIAFAGAGANLDSAARPARLVARTCTLALVAFSKVATADQFATGTSPGVATAYDPARLLREIAAARTWAGVVAVYLHWGREKAAAPDESQRRLARQCIDAGADLVIGTHAHVVQGMEYYRGRLIAYSLGNFLFTNRDGRPALALQTSFRNRTMTAARVVPCRIRDLRPERLRGETALRSEYRRLSVISTGARVDESGLVLP